MIAASSVKCFTRQTSVTSRSKITHMSATSSFHWVLFNPNVDPNDSSSNINVNATSKRAYSSNITMNSWSPKTTNMTNMSSPRYFSTQPTTATTTATTDGTFYSEQATSSVENTLSKLVSNSNPDATITATSAAEAVTENTVSVSDAYALVFDPSWYNPADQAVKFLNYIDSFHDMPYAFTIIGSTLAIRTLLLPIFVQGQRNASRMAHMTPELNVLKQRVEQSGGRNADMAVQAKQAEEMKALFRKYNCNPLKSLIPPIVQAPVFMSMFFALKKMPEYFPDPLSVGGLAWFPDLTLADPLYILPVASSLSFLATIELSKKTMASTSPDQANLMTNIFRGLGVIMIPVTINFSTAILIYWVTNNTFSAFQTAAFQNKSIRKQLDIWDPPKQIAGAPPPKGIKEMWDDYMKEHTQKGTMEEKKEAMKKHNQQIAHLKLEQQVKATGIGGKKKRSRRKRR